MPRRPPPHRPVPTRATPHRGTPHRAAAHRVLAHRVLAAAANVPPLLLLRYLFGVEVGHAAPPDPDQHVLLTFRVPGEIYQAIGWSGSAILVLVLAGVPAVLAALRRHRPGAGGALDRGLAGRSGAPAAGTVRRVTLRRVPLRRATLRRATARRASARRVGAPGGGAPDRLPRSESGARRHRGAPAGRNGSEPASPPPQRGRGAPAGMR
jgi:hypothetical protein